MKINKTLQDFKNINGTYVSAGKTLSEMQIPILELTDSEIEMYYKIFQKVLSGKTGKNVVEVNTNKENLTETIIQNLQTDKRYCILSAKGAREDEETITPYEIIAVCPVKDSKTALRYNTEKEFRGFSTGSVLGMPMIGMLKTDSLSYYFAKDKHNELLEALGEIPKSDQEIKDSLYTALSKDFGDRAPEVASHIQTKFAAETSIPRSSVLSEIGREFSVEAENTKSALGEGHIPHLGDKTIIETPNIKLTATVGKAKFREIDGRKFILIPVEDVIALNGTKL